MKRKQTVLTVLALSMAACMLTCGRAQAQGRGQGRAAPVQDSPGSASIVAVLELKSLDEVTEEAGTLFGTLGLDARKTALTSGLEIMLHAPGFAGIDRTGPVRMYVVAPTVRGTMVLQPKQPQVLVVPLSGAQAGYLEALGQLYEEQSGTGDLKTFRAAAAAPVGVSQNLHVRIADGKAFVSAEAWALRFIAAEYAAGREKSHLKALPGTVRLGLNVAALAPALKQAVAMAQMAAAQQPAQRQGPVLNTAAMLQAQGNMLVGIVEQIDTVTVALADRERSVDLLTRLAAVDGSTFASILKETGTPSDRYLSMIPEDAVFAHVTGGMDAFDDMAKGYADFCESMYAAMGPDMAKLAPAMRENLLRAQGLYAGDMAMALVPRPDGKGIGFMEFIAVTDKDKAMNVLRDSVKALQETRAPGVSVTVQPERTHKGVSILSYTMNIDPSASVPDGTPVPGAALSWLKNLHTEAAVVGHDLIYTLGGGGIMERAIELVREGGVPIMKCAPFSSLFVPLKKPPVKVHGLSLVKLVKTALSGLPQANTQMLDMIPDTSRGLAGYSVRHGDDLVSVLRISHDEITTLKSSAAMIGGMFAQMMMSDMIAAGAAAGTGSSAEACKHNLRVIDAAKEQLALERELTDGAKVEGEALKTFLPGSVIPTCPEGGAYKINPVGVDPECSHPGHAL